MARLILCGIVASALWAATHQDADAVTLSCSAHPARCEQALRWTKHEIRTLRREARRRYRPTVRQALVLASFVSGRSLSSLTRQAWCESRLDPTATNGRYLGLFQLGGHHLADPLIRVLGWWNPFANAMHAALYQQRHGSGEWECPA